LLKQQDDLDYDVIMQEYHNQLRKERELHDQIKNKKANDVEIWARALKEEEAVAMKQYCDEHGKEEVKNIIDR
jgi:hypothetical protein